MSVLGRALLLALTCAVAPRCGAQQSQARFAQISTVPLSLIGGRLDPIAMRSSRNVAYYGPVQLGTPPRTFTMCFDTGSGDIWVPSVNCLDPACVNHNQYSAAYSQTAMADELQAFAIKYGTGQVAGYVDFDILKLGSPSLQITHQGFGEAYQASDDFSSTSCDGLFGLGFPSISRTNTTPPFFNMVGEKQLHQNLFSIWLNPNQSAEIAGELIFGDINAAHFAGELHTIPLTRDLYWQVELQGVRLGTRTLQLTANEAILDSGTTGIVVSKEDAVTINSLVPDLEYDSSMDIWLIDCDEVGQLPNLTFVLGGQAYDLPGPEWTVELGGASTQCASLVMGLGMPESNAPIILGAAFLRMYYSVYMYEQGGSSVALARAQPRWVAPAVGLADLRSG